MKVCNNCSAINTASAVKCVQCNMADNFTLQGISVATSHSGTLTIQCINCGSRQPGNGATCVDCRFPLPEQPGSANIGTSSVIGSVPNSKPETSNN